MPDPRSNIVAILRTELANEAASGFLRLKRLPATDTIWFLDYYAALESAEQSALLDGLAEWGAIASFPTREGAYLVQQLERQNLAFGRWRALRNRMGYKGGTRYTDVKMLCMDKGLRDIGYYHEDYRKNCSLLAFQPRADLLPDLSYLKPAKPTLLRKLVNAALTKRFTLEKKPAPGTEGRYVGSFGNHTLTVSVDFGSRLGQVRYEVSVDHPEYTVKVARLSYERLWDCNLGWDYLTEENAGRSIDFWAEQVQHLVSLADRIRVCSIRGSQA